MTIDLNPRENSGGQSNPPQRSVYLGNFGAWKSPLDAARWRQVAIAAYHNEIAHHWGWPGTHDWAGSCGGRGRDHAPFPVPPILFGWEDLDGDHVPDILSIAPDGRRLDAAGK